MTEELRDVLGAAEVAAENGLPAFDHVVMARSVTQRAKRRRAVRHATTGFIAAVSLGVVGFGGYLAYAGLNDEADPVITPSPTDEPQPSPTGDRPEVADRVVTTGVGLPDAVALTDEAYAAADTGWVLAIFDSTQFFQDWDPIESERVLYLISPAGERYEVANLTRFGSPHLAAWDTDRQVALIVENRYVALTLDLASGEVTHEWQFCGEGGSMTAKDLPGNEWLLRGVCSGEPLDGIYTDDFTLVTDEGIVKGSPAEGITDVGDVQVRNAYGTDPEYQYRAFHPNGTEVAMRQVDDVACYPAGITQLGGLAVACYHDDDRYSIWNLDPDGGEPSPIITSDVMAAVESAIGEMIPGGGYYLTGFSLTHDGVHDVLTMLTSTQPAVVVMIEDVPVVMTNGEYWATQCHGGVGGTVLVSGGGVLWTWDAFTGQIVTLLPVSEPEVVGGTVAGASEGGAVVHP